MLNLQFYIIATPGLMKGLSQAELCRAALGRRRCLLPFLVAIRLLGDFGMQYEHCLLCWQLQVSPHAIPQQVSLVWVGPTRQRFCWAQCTQGCSLPSAGLWGEHRLCPGWICCPTASHRARRCCSTALRLCLWLHPLAEYGTASHQGEAMAGSVWQRIGQKMWIKTCADSTVRSKSCSAELPAAAAAWGRARLVWVPPLPPSLRNAEAQCWVTAQHLLVPHLH